MGTPHFADTILHKLIQWNGADIIGVYTRPDKKSGRGMRLLPSPVKITALENNIPLFQPPTLRNEEAQRQLRESRPDFIVVASYGLILPQSVLDAALVAPVNVHASLLPMYRGAAPIQRAIMENWGPDAQTGVSIMKMTAELDAGPVYMQRKVPIAYRYFTEIAEDMAKAGGEALVETLEKLSVNGIQPKPQDAGRATYAAKLEKKDGIIDWTTSAAQVDAAIRALTPWPGATAVLEFENGTEPIPVSILSARVGEPLGNVECGSVLRSRDGLGIACADRWLHVENLRPQGKKEMKSADFANGRCKIKQGICGRALAPHEQI